MEKNKRKWVTLLLLVFTGSILLTFILISREGENMPNGRYKKVLVIGIDAMDPKISQKLMAEGKMPNFKRLAEQGSFAELPTTMPPHSPVAWTSMATGTNPGKHNIFDFIRRDPTRYIPQLSLSEMVSGLGGTKYKSLVKAKTFWKITSEHNIPVTIIRWPVTFPPEELLGDLLAGLGVPDIKGFLSGYSYYTSESFDTRKEENKHMIRVEQGNILTTRISGPVKKSGQVYTPMGIVLDKKNGKAILKIQDKTYEIQEHGWSDWIHVTFKVGVLKEVSGITTAYLESIEPFRMYMSDVEIDPENPLWDISFPSGYSAELAQKIGSTYHTLGLAEDTGALNDGKISDDIFLQQVDQLENERDRMFWKEFEEFEKKERAVLALVYDSGDRVQHMFWDDKILDKKHAPLNPAITAYYIKKDEWLGDVLNRIDENTAVAVVSDHGISSFERAVSINTWLVENGYMTLKKDIEDFEDGDEGGLFKYVDWSKTKAYSVGFNSLYINMKGRERDGIVGENEKEALLNELTQKLTGLEDPEYGRAVFKVYDAQQIYIGPAAYDGPDLTIGFNPGFRMSWQNAIGGFSKEVFFTNEKHWKGDHLVDPSFVPGVVFTNFKIRSGEIHQMDVAPTVLAALGIPIPEEIDGRSLLS